MNKKNKRNQWHPGFVAAIDLELSANRADLIYEKEYNLNTNPLEIDLLVVKKASEVRLKNEIGAIFRKYNIMEYKSPKDELGIDELYKAEAYAGLYKAYGDTADARKAEEITVSLLRDIRPKKLFQYFKEHDISLKQPYQGIYYVKQKVWFPTQIIVTSELNKKNHLWLSALTEHLQMQDLQEILEASEKLNGKYDKALVESVLQVSVTANEDLIKKVRGEKRMCEALMEILEPEIRAREEKAVAEAEATAEKRMQETKQEMKKAFRLIQGGCDTVESLVEKGISRSVAEDVLGD
jgi:hypothetical protein